MTESNEINLVFLILAHGAVENFRELVETLQKVESAKIVAHIDAKTNVQPFREVAPNVTFVENRQTVTWGRWSQVQADLELCKTALSILEGQKAHLMLISGDSYPLVPPKLISEFFSKNKLRQFMNVAAMPAPHLHKPIFHLTRRFIWDYDHRNGKLNLLPKLVNNILPMSPKKGLDGLQPMCGSAWWTITTEAASWILNYTATHPKLVRYFQKMRCPDEKFFQTLLTASPFAKELSGANMFADFDRPSGPSPAIVDDQMIDFLSDLPSLFINHQGYGPGLKMFVRKFGEYNPEIYRRLRQSVWNKHESLFEDYVIKAGLGGSKGKFA